MLGDNITLKDIGIDELLRKARSGRLPHCIGGPWRELIGQRAYRLESAEAIVNDAVSEGRSMTPDECRHVDGLVAEAESISPVIKELWESERRELMEGVPLR